MPVMTNKGSDAADATAEAIAEAVTDDEGTFEVTADVEELVTDSGTPEVESEFVAVSQTTAAVGRGLLVPVLIGASVAALAGAGFFGWQFWQQHQLDQAREGAQRSAVSYAQVLTSVDSNNVDDNFKQVLDGATGEFKDMYSKSSVELRQLLIENKASAHGVVVESAVQEASKDRAVVLLFIDQSVANTKLPDPRIDRSRMKMTLEKVDGSWRASKVELP
jgi:Mce-associated membrane protein